MSRLLATYTLEPSLLRALESEAELRGLSKSELVNRLLSKSLEMARAERIRIGEAAVSAGLGAAVLTVLAVLVVVL